MTFAKFI